MKHNHGYQTVDPLKPFSVHNGHGFPAHNHGYQTVDPLKPDLFDEAKKAHPGHNHGYQTVDPLKLNLLKQFDGYKTCITTVELNRCAVGSLLPWR